MAGGIKMKLRDLPKTERPRERLVDVGAGYLSTTELLAILLGSGTQNNNVMILAQELLNKYPDGLAQLFNADIEDLQGLKGIGKAKAIQLKAAFELDLRLHQSKNRNGETYFKTTQDIVNYYMPMLRFQKQEYLFCAYLNARGKLIKSDTISMGNIEGSTFYPNEIFRGALASNVTKIIIVHNHPSGNPTPSNEDIKVTKKLNEGARLLGLRILDHVIIGDRRYCSLKERNLMG